ncbi:hypothetical protein DW886_08205 [Enterocloster aldenensis]|nr:hypothetical protein DW886_08205 [Enterocloster aldenensis]
MRTLPPHCRQAQELVARWQSYISDQRFTENIDKHGKGTAAFMAAAIESYCRANG